LDAPVIFLKEEVNKMAISVATNVGSLNAQRNLNRTQEGLSRNLSRLSSGLRINQASDDAAGLAISEKLKGQIRSLAQAQRNSNDAVSLLQTAEGAMNETSGLVIRMRELAVQSANDTVGSTERAFLNNELTELRKEVDRIAEVTEFNGTKLIDGAATSLTFQVGINNSTNDRITVGINDMHAAALGTSTAASLGAVDISTITGAQNALSVLDDAITDISAGRAEIGAVQNRMYASIQSLATAQENLAAANSRIRDADIAQESANLTKNSILMQAGVSVLAQANQQPALALSLLG
jgi:flagellin